MNTRRCLNREGELTISPEWDAAQVITERDGRGLTLRESWLDAEGQAMMTRRGYATRTSRYDARGAIIAQAALDQSGRPTFNAEGWSEKRFARTARGDRSAFGRSTRSGTLVADPTGVAERRFSYSLGYIKERWLGADGQPVAAHGGGRGARPSL